MRTLVLRRPNIFYGWYIVAAASIAGFINFSILQLGQSLMVKDVSDEFMWSLTAISIGFSLRTLQQGVMAPLGGYLTDRFGSRTMALIGIVFMFTGLLTFSLMHQLWQFYLSSASIALGQGLGANQAYLNSVVQWFRRKRGRASSFLAMGRGWSYVAIFPISLLLVTFGWRTASMVTAIIYLVVTLPCALTLRDRPEAYGYLPDGDPPSAVTEGADVAAPRADDGDFSVRDALRQRAFWMLLINMMIYSYSQQTYAVHFLTLLRFRGFSAAAAAAVLTVHGLLQVAGRLGVGWVADRNGRARTMGISQYLMAVGWGVMPFITPHTMWVALPIFFASFGMGQAAYTVTSQTIVADYFGTRRFATIRGMMNPMSVVGGLIGPVAAGLSKDHLGTYAPAFLVLVPLMLVAALALRLAGQPTLSGEDHEERRAARAAAAALRSEADGERPPGRP